MNQKIPQHIAIVMDGNGRWAESRGLLRIEGHRAGAGAVRTVVQCCLQHQIKVLSLFAFSSENWLRPEDEVDFLMQLFVEALNKEVQELYQHGVCLRFSGDRTQLSPLLCAQMQSSEELTAANDKLILNVVVNYGGRWDIVQATKILAQNVAAGKMTLEQINENSFAQCLNTYNLPDPDLFIRTSGEQRISNFFLWQLAYTELYFSKMYWPDFNEEEFAQALLAFGSRERRYGQIKVTRSKEQHV